MEAHLATAVDGAPAYRVPLHAALTRSEQLVPGSAFPALTTPDQALVARWLAHDTATLTREQHAQAQRRNELIHVTAQIRDNEDWLGRAVLPLASTSIITESRRANVKASGKLGKNRLQLKFSKAQLNAIANERETLIPIRIDIEHATSNLHDTFTWNLRETVLTPEIFASHLCEDLRLPFHLFYREIVEQIKRGIDDGNLATYDAHLGEGNDQVKDENRDWFEDRAKRRKLHDEPKDSEDIVIVGEEQEVVASGETGVGKDELDAEGKNEDLRVLIRLDITLDSVQLVDKFEWDISNSSNSPEEFAEIFTSDLGLSGEFRTAVSHAIREQIDVYTKSLLLLGHVSGLPVTDEDLRREFLPSLTAIRADVDDYTPTVVQLSTEEMERNAKEGDREVRRKRRQTKGRGVTLPDRAPVRTRRTLLPVPALLHAAPSIDGFALPADIARPFPIIRPVLPNKPPTVLEISPQLPLPATPRPPTAQAPSPSKPKGKSKKSSARKGDSKGLSDTVCSHCGALEISPVRREGVDALCAACGEYFDQNHRLPNLRAQQSTSRQPTPKVKPRRNYTSAPATVHDADSDDSDESSASNSDDDDDDSDNASSNSESPEVSTASRSMRGSTLRKRAVVQRSPDLPYVNPESPDSADEVKKIAPVPVAAPVVRPPPPPTRIASTNIQPPPNLQQPPWMNQTAIELQDRFKNDRFEIISRGKASESGGTVYEWRIRCLDCPGKLYNIGPLESLDNFAVHFKNRNHRAAVDARLRRVS